MRPAVDWLLCLELEKLILELTTRGMIIGSGEGSTMRNFIVFTVIKSRRLRWAGHVARIEEGRSTFKILISKDRGKGPLGRSRRRWEDNIRMDLV